MFDIGFAELMVVGVVALIVVGPKDLPRMFRTVGQYVGKARGMARQFQRAMDDAARHSDLDEVRDIGKTVKTAMDPLGSATNAAREYATQFNRDIADMNPPEQTKAPSRAEQVKAANAAAETYVPPTPAEPEPKPASDAGPVPASDTPPAAAAPAADTDPAPKPH